MTFIKSISPGGPMRSPNLLTRPRTRKLMVIVVIITALMPFAARTASAASPITVAPGAHLFPAAQAFDQAGKTVTLPLQRGLDADGHTVLYIITESSNFADAQARGINWSPKLAVALGTKAVQRVRRAGRALQFSGTVDFSPTRVVQPGPTGFPPSRAEPGSVGDAQYSPLITIGDGIVLNAPQIANRTGLHDEVTSIDPHQRSATLRLLAGFYDGVDVLYVRTEASDPVVAAVEGTTLAPNLGTAPGVGTDDPSLSAREGIVPIINGPGGTTNPQRQGLNSFLFGEGDPLNIIQEEPEGNSSLRYSPVWDVSPAQWTDQAVIDGTRHQLRSIDRVAAAIAQGGLTSGASGPVNTSLGGLRAADIVSICPVIFVAPRNTNAG